MYPLRSPHSAKNLSVADSEAAIFADSENFNLQIKSKFWDDSQNLSKITWFVIEPGFRQLIYRYLAIRITKIKITSQGEMWR